MQEPAYVNMEDVSVMRDLSEQRPTLSLSPCPEVGPSSDGDLPPNEVSLPEDGLLAPPPSPIEPPPAQMALTGAQLEAVAIALEAVHGGTGRRSTRSHPEDLAGPLEGARRSKRKSSVSNIVIILRKKG